MVNLAVELVTDGREQWVALQDVSTTGMFLEVAPQPHVGKEVAIAIAPEGRRVVTAARVTHALSATDARVLSRAPGIGVAFQPDATFARAIDCLLRARQAIAQATSAHVVVADKELRLLERMSSALGQAGFSVATASNGLETIAACFRQTPDVVLLGRDLPVCDGFQVLAQMQRYEGLATVPVIMISDDPSDLTHAFERGASDFIPKPFSAYEVIARARRLLTKRDTTFRGSIAEFGLPALLALLEQGKKTGRLVVTNTRTAWIDLELGQIVGAGPEADALSILASVLDWNDGTFELISRPPDRRGTIAQQIMQLLHDHARLREDPTDPMLRPA